MVSIARFAVRRPTAVILCPIIIFSFGIQSLLGTKVELTSEVELLMLVTSTVYAGINPDDVSELITMKQEDAVTSLDGVDTIQSYSQEGVSVIMVQCEYGASVSAVYTNLKRAMDNIHNDLPNDANEPATTKPDLSAQPAMTLAVSEQVDGNLYTYVGDNVVPLFEKLGSVGEVFLSSNQKNHIRVELISGKLGQYHLTMSAVGQTVGATNFITPTGRVKVGKQDLDVSVGSDYDNTEGLKSVATPLANGDVIHLSDIAGVYDALEGADSISRYSGSGIISLDIRKQQSSAAIDVSRGVTKEIQEIGVVNPGIRIIAVNDSSEIIAESISDVSQAMIITVIPSTTVLWLFYDDPRVSVIAETSIPISIMLALTSMSAMGFSLSVTSPIPLVLGAGMMVDSSINMLDGCFRAKEKHSFYSVAIKGSCTMTGSITGGATTTCVALFPLVVLSGMSGQLFKQLGYTIVFCMIASLLSTMSIVPLCYHQ